MPNKYSLTIISAHMWLAPGWSEHQGEKRNDTRSKPLATQLPDRSGLWEEWYDCKGNEPLFDVQGCNFNSDAKAQ